jgi:hypothetical protein
MRKPGIHENSRQAFYRRGPVCGESFYSDLRLVRSEIRSYDPLETTKSRFSWSPGFLITGRDFVFNG